MPNTMESILSIPAIKRMYNRSNETLNITDLRDVTYLKPLAKLIGTGRCKIINFQQSLDLEIVIRFLSILSTHKNLVKELNIDIWNTDYDNFIESLKESLNSHQDSLESLAIKCRFPPLILAKVLDFLPNKLRVLDISENTISEPSCLEPLARYIESGRLERLKMVNCNLKGNLLVEFVKYLSSIESPFTLMSLEGVDLSQCSEIPLSVRKSFGQPGNKIRKTQMNYKDYSKTAKHSSNIQFIDYLRNNIFMKTMVGSKVRVWWPATNDDTKTSYSGRFWPAKVLMANPIDLIFVVKYDNDDVEHVPCKCIQPLNPFQYGGGLDNNYLTYVIGSKLNKDNKNFKENLSHRGSQELFSRQTNSEKNDTSNSFRENENRQLNMENVNTPQNYYNSVSSSFTGFESIPSSSNSMETKYEDNFICKNCGFNNNSDNTLNMNMRLESIESTLEISNKFMGNLLVPGEFCEFRDPLDQFRDDPSDYVAVVTKVNKKEPLYDCLCIYQDDNEVVQVNSKDIRRAVVIPWYNWVNLAFSLLMDLKNQQGNLEKETPSRYSESTVKSLNGSPFNLTHHQLKHQKSGTIYLDDIIGGGSTVSGNSLEYSFTMSECSVNTGGESSNLSETNSNYEYDGSVEENFGNKTQELLETISFSERKIDDQIPISKTNHLNENFLYIKPIELEELVEYYPPNPLEMKLLDLNSYTKLLEDKVVNHPKLHMDSPNENEYEEDLKIKSLMQYNQILQNELEIERRKNMELQSKFNCVLCLDTQINCMLDPCGHFSFCYEDSYKEDERNGLIIENMGFNEKTRIELKEVELI